MTEVSGRNMSEISVEYGLEGPERVAASLVIILDIEQD